MRNILIIAALALAGCATTTTTAAPPLPEVVCPPNQEAMRTAQLFFGRNIGDKPGVSEDEFRKFLDEEMTPRFPEGLTILDGGGQWRGGENELIREAAKVVIVVAPLGRETQAKINAAREAYKRRFRQEAVLVITQTTCVSF